MRSADEGAQAKLGCSRKSEQKENPSLVLGPCGCGNRTIHPIGRVPSADLGMGPSLQSGLACWESRNDENLLMIQVDWSPPPSCRTQTERGETRSIFANGPSHSSPTRDFVSVSSVHFPHPIIPPPQWLVVAKRTCKSFRMARVHLSCATWKKLPPMCRCAL